MPSSPEGQADETPTVEVRVYRDGRLMHRELCESERPEPPDEEAYPPGPPWTGSTSP